MLSKHEQIFAIKNNRENLTKFNASVGKKKMLKKFWKSLREKIKSNKEKVVKREKN